MRKQKRAAGKKIGLTYTKVIAALRKSGGVKSAAAALLGCSANTIRYHLKKHG